MNIEKCERDWKAFGTLFLGAFYDEVKQNQYNYRKEKVYTRDIFKRD